VSPADARRFRASLVDRGLARGTIKHAFDVFRRVLDVAVQDGAIPANPAAVVPLPRRNATGDAEPFAPHPLTSGHVAAVSAHIGNRHKVYGLVVLFLACTGLRAAELAGLEVGDVDVDRRTVRVARTKRKVRGGWETGTPKSRKSRRVVPLDEWLVDDLRAYLDTHPRRDDPEAPLFPARYGRNARVPRAEASDGEIYNWAVPIEPGTFYANYFRPALAAVGLPATDPKSGTRGVRLHDLRHTYAVLSLSAGAHYMQVSKWLGHESYVTTLTIYADYIPEEDGKTALARPTAPAPAADNVVPLRPRATG
jgi:integrase